MYTLTVKWQDADCQVFDPREDDNLGTMTCFHGSYTLGDEHDFMDEAEMLLELVGEFDEVDENTEVEKLRALLHKYYVVLPLYLYDHSGITMNTSGFSCRWDSGQVGYIYVSHDKARKEYGWTRITKGRIELLKEYLTAEVKTYDQYLTGELYEYVIEDEDGDIIDSCSGFYSEADARLEGEAALKYAINAAEVRAEREQFPVATMGI